MSHDRDAILKAAADILARPTPLLPQAELDAFVCSFLDRREVFLAAVRDHGSPLYLLDEDALRRRAEELTAAFRRELPDVGVYYAIKSNNCPAVAARLVQAGLGLDVSSGLELELALRCGASDIVFSGPAKTDAELHLAVQHADRVTVLMDSFAELGRLDQAASQAGVHIRAGVRLTTDGRGLWRKFGIPLGDLGRFVHAADSCRSIRLRGLQFHTSWNLDPTNHVRFLERLGATLAGLDAPHRAAIEFVDIGGGFWPGEGDWMQPAGTPEGRLREAVLPPGKPSLAHHRLAAAPIGEFARQIAAAARAQLFPHVRCRICLEPGRWICHPALHLLLTVMDRKGDDIAITDGATNAIGWERFETDYFPVLNLSRPELTERECYVLGSLCTPHDVWGYGYFGQDIQPGDVLLIPTQGAYTYSLRQHFIKPLPRLVVLKADGTTEDASGE